MVYNIFIQGSTELTVSDCGVKIDNEMLAWCKANKCAAYMEDSFPAGKRWYCIETDNLSGTIKTIEKMLCDKLFSGLVPDYKIYTGPDNNLQMSCYGKRADGTELMLFFIKTCEDRFFNGPSGIYKLC